MGNRREPRGQTPATDPKTIVNIEAAAGKAEPPKPIVANGTKGPTPHKLRVKRRKERRATRDDELVVGAQRKPGSNVPQAGQPKPPAMAVSVV